MLTGKPEVRRKNVKTLLGFLFCLDRPVTGILVGKYCKFATPDHSVDFVESSSSANVLSLLSLLSFSGMKKGQSLRITDAIPTFHNYPLAPMMELSILQVHGRFPSFPIVRVVTQQSARRIKGNRICTAPPLLIIIDVTFRSTNTALPTIFAYSAAITR